MLGEHTLDGRKLNDSSALASQNVELQPAQRRLRVVTLRKTTPLRVSGQNSNFQKTTSMENNCWVNEEDGTPFSANTEKANALEELRKRR